MVARRVRNRCCKQVCRVTTREGRRCVSASVVEMREGGTRVGASPVFAVVCFGGRLSGAFVEWLAFCRHYWGVSVWLGWGVWVMFFASVRGGSLVFPSTISRMGDCRGFGRGRQFVVCLARYFRLRDFGVGVCGCVPWSHEWVFIRRRLVGS